MSEKETTPDFAEMHIDYDNTLTHDIKRDIGATVSKTPEVWKRADEHVKSTTQEGNSFREKIERFVQTARVFMVDIGMFKSIRNDVPMALDKIKSLLPELELKVNSSRLARQGELTQRFASPKLPHISEYNWQETGLSPEETKVAVLDRSLKALDEKGLPKSGIIVVDDNSKHLEELANHSPDRVMAYWLSYGREWPTERSAIPANVAVVNSLGDVYNDLESRVGDKSVAAGSEEKD